MPRGALVLILLLLAAVAAMLLFVPADTQPGSATPGAVVPEGDSSPEAGRIEGPSEDTQRETVQAPVPGVEEEDPERTFLPSSDVPDALVVRCVARDGGEPLPGAVVYRLDQSRIDEATLMSSMMTGGSIVELLEQHGDLYRAGSDGEVRVAPGDDLAIAGRHEGMFHLLQVWEESPGSVILLELYRQPQLEVEVVDEAGAPLAGVKVALRILWDDWRWDLMARASDAEGIATFADFDAMFVGLQDNPMAVGLAEVLHEPVEVEVEEAHLTGEAGRLRLVMPPTGIVEVQVLDHAGNPCADGVIVMLLPRYDEEELEYFGLGGGDGRSAHALTVGGIARFAHVALGQEISAAAYLNGYAQPSQVDGHGPASAGETVRLELHEDLTLPTLTGRALSDGAPLGDVMLTVAVRNRYAQGHWDQELTVQTEPDGSFRVQIGEREDEVVPPRDALLMVRRDDTLLYASATLPSDFDGGTHDLGPLTLTPAPVLVAGTVVDAAGQPVHGAALQIEREQQWGDDPDDRYWYEIEDGARSAADGSFMIRGRPPEPGALRLVVGHPGHQPTVKDFALGADGVEIRMQGAGLVEGNVLLDEGISADLIEVTVEYPGGLPPELEERVELWDTADPGSGRFAIHSLPPGVVTVTLRAGDDFDAALFEGVAVGPGLKPDPRLKDIDLRGRVYLHELRILDPSGSPIENAMVIEAGEEQAWHWAWDGIAEILSPSRAVDLSVISEGYRSASLTGFSGKGEITLQAGIPVVVRWDGGPPAGGKVAWGIRMVPTGDGPTWMFSAEAWFEATNEVRLVLPEPGEYELWFQLRDEETWSSHEIGPDGPLDALLVEVLDGTAVQRIRVGLSAQTLDQALAELARMAVEEVGLPMPVPYDD